MSAEERFCIFDDQKVRPISKGDNEWGKGGSQTGYVHERKNEAGVPFCGRRLLSTENTYTLSDVGTSEE